MQNDVEVNITEGKTNIESTKDKMTKGKKTKDKMTKDKMANDNRNNDHITNDKIINDDITNNRRKRINRMKTIIVAVVIMLILLPTLGTIILGIQVSRLQKQVNQLLIQHGEEISDGSLINDSYAYAAEKSSSASTITQNTQEDNNDQQTASPIEQSNPKEDNNTSSSGINLSVLNSDKSKDNTITTSKTVNNTADMLGSSGNKSITKTVKDIEKTEPKKATTTNAQKHNSSKDEIKSLNTGIYAGKKVYLTFDDGPSIYTDEILDILKEYNVKATFFVTGRTDDKSKKIYKRIVEEGHTLGMHSYSHVYSYIYNSVEDFDKDFTKLWKLLYDTTGYKPTIFRFPGGSANLVNKNGMTAFIKYLNEKKIVYYDWNVENGDATGITYTDKQLINNVLNGIEKKDNSIVLMHDAQSKRSTVDSLPKLLETLTSDGADILPIDKNVPPIQQNKADQVK